MKILIIHQYFNTPASGGPLRSYYIARGLMENGYEVEVITSHNGKNYLQKEVEGFPVHYLPVYYDNSLRFPGRIHAFIKFAWLAYKKALTISRVKLCYAISTPLTVGWIALKLKAKKKIPYFFEVGDLWPEAPVQLGVLRSQWIINKVKKFEKKVYQESERIVALSPGIKESILKTSPISRITIIPNMSDCNFFQLESKNEKLVDEFGVKDKMVITYFGAAGKANHLDYLLDAARYAQSNNGKLHFLIAAHGSELPRIKKLAVEYNLNNLNFLPYCNRARLKNLLNVTDAVYVSYASAPILTTGSPNKFFDGLAAGKLMIVNFHGWIRNIIEGHGLGFYADPGKPERLVELSCTLADNPPELLRLQKNARVIAETFFSRQLAIQNLLKCLNHQQQTLIKEPEVYTLTA